MVALAAVEDVAARLDRTLTPDETRQAAGLLEEASDLAAAWMRCVPEPVPAEVVRVVSRMVARVMSVDPATPVGLTQTQFSEQAGPMGVTRSQSFSEDATTRAPWLTRNDKTVLRRFGCRGRVENVATA